MPKVDVGTKGEAPNLPPPAVATRPTEPVLVKGSAFLAERLAAAASELRDLIQDAWAASLDARVGYPEVAVKAIIAKPSVLTQDVFGID